MKIYIMIWYFLRVYSTLICSYFAILSCCKVSMINIFFSICINNSVHITFAVIEGETAITLVSSPAGRRVSGTASTFDYPILSSVTLTCIVYPIPSVPVTYRWNTEKCYVDNHNESRCFPAGKTTQSVSEDNLIAKDAGTITCTAILLGQEYTSDEFTLRISGMVKYF